MRRTRPAASGSEAGGRHRPVLEFLDARHPYRCGEFASVEGPGPSTLASLAVSGLLGPGRRAVLCDRLRQW